MAELYRTGQSRAVGGAQARRRCARSGAILRREGWIDDDPAALAATPKRERKDAGASLRWTR